MKKYFLNFDLLFSNIFIFIIIAIMGLIVINLHVFDPFKRAFQDFEFNDIYYSKIQNNQSSTDTNIIIVNIGNLQRDSIAFMLNRINKEQPKVVGIDAFFTKRRDYISDSLLKFELGATKNLVLSGILRNADGRNYIVGTNKWFGNYNLTYANLTGNDANLTTIREFSPFINERDTFWSSFSAEIVKKYNFNAWSYLKTRCKSREIINFSGNNNSYICLDNAIFFDKSANLNVLKNKIVLLGYMGNRLKESTDLEDLHFTPLNRSISGRAIPDMRGIVIQANIISMILNKNFINESPKWLNWIIAFILCYLHLILFIYLYFHQHKWYHFVGKIVQFVSSVFLIWISFLIYKNFNIKISFTPAIVAIMLSIDLLYFYEGLIKILNNKAGFKSIFYKH